MRYQIKDTILKYYNRTVSTFTNWQLPSGGFGGGNDQLAHLATTYAAINALAIAGTKETYDVLNR